MDRAFAAWQLEDARFRQDAQLVATELITNAIVHGGGAPSLELELEEGAVTIAVRDGSAALPEPRQATETEAGGRGLAIVAALAESWGVELPAGGGKRVWARVAR